MAKSCTRAAYRAARGIVIYLADNIEGGGSYSSPAAIDRIAELIDTETGLPELIQAAICAAALLEGLMPNSDTLAGLCDALVKAKE
jgi:hypothetical protein